MRHRQSVSAIIGMFALAVLASCGATAEVSTSLTPADGATNQALDVTVTATFSGGGILDSDLPLVMGLFKNGAGSTLCTSFAYNSNSHVATCNHDLLESGTSYTIAVSPFRNIRGAVAVFTTISLPAIATKKAIEGSGSFAVTFAFPSSLSAESAPRVTIAVAEEPSQAVAGCTLSDDRTQLVCPITCDGEAADCTVALSGNGIAPQQSSLDEIALDEIAEE